MIPSIKKNVYYPFIALINLYAENSFQNLDNLYKICIVFTLFPIDLVPNEIPFGLRKDSSVCVYA